MQFRHKLVSSQQNLFTILFILSFIKTIALLTLGKRDIVFNPMRERDLFEQDVCVFYIKDIICL